MTYIRDKLFILWLLLLVFGHQLTAYTGVASPDKLITPFLILMGLIALFQSPESRMKRAIPLMLLVFLLLLIKNLSFMGLNDVYSSLMSQDLVNFGYFFVPFLCITNMHIFRRTGWLIVVIAIIGCVSPFLVSIGLISLPIGWFEDSRIGGLLKTKGLFLSNGDLVQYITFAAAWVILAPGIINKKSKSLRFIRIVLFTSIILGLLGTQSRNVLLSLFVGLFVLWWLIKSGVFTSGQKTIVIFGFSFGFMILLVITAIFSAESYDTLVAAGGESAKRTAETRLSQYSVAWDIITTYPLLGADLETYITKGHLIGYIHNIWFRMLAHGGIITALVLLLLLVRTFSGIRSAARISEKSDEAMVVTAYFASMFVALLFYVALGLMFWSLLGVAAALICIEPFSNTAKETDKSEKQNDTSVQVKQPVVRTGVKWRT